MYKQTSVNGEDFVGLLGFASDKYAIVAPGFRDVKALDVPTMKTTIYGTNLLGLFCAGNSNGILVPYFIEKEKTEKIRKELKEYGLDINIAQVDDVYTALGNLVACNDKAAIISPNFKNTKVFSDTLDVEVIQTEIAGHPETGACCIATNKGFLVHPDAESDLANLAEIFKVPGREGTINFGFPFVKAGLIANSKGYLTGMRTSGIELGRIDDALGFF